MNILVLGNGFDLAHDLPTSYSDFLEFLHCIELTSSWHGNKNEFVDTHLDKNKMDNFVIGYIEAAFDTRKSVPNNNYANSNPLIQEIYDNLNDNVWYEYLQYVFNSGKMCGVNWIDFEREISFIIERIDKEQQNIYLPFNIQLSDDDRKVKRFLKLISFTNYLREKKKPTNYVPTYYDFIEKSFQDLRQLIRCLEIYLTECVEKISITKISPDIKGIDVHAVLNFNYTHTYANNYLPNVPIHYLHGETHNSMALGNNMVLGIDEYRKGSDRDNFTNYNIYKKFTQRIINETGFLYRDWIKTNDDNYHRFKDKIKDYHTELFVFGHSLDVTDKDVLKDLIYRPSVRTTIFYHDKQQQTQQIANLVKMLGQDTFIDMINSVPPKISFVQQQPLQNKV